MHTPLRGLLAVCLLLRTVFPLPCLFMHSFDCSLIEEVEQVVHGIAPFNGRAHGHVDAASAELQSGSWS